MSDPIMELYLANRNGTLGLEEVVERDMVDIRPASRRAVPLNEPVAPVPVSSVPIQPTGLAERIEQLERLCANFQARLFAIEKQTLPEKPAPKPGSVQVRPEPSPQKIDRMRVQWSQLVLNGSPLTFDEFRQLPKKKRNALLQEVGA